MKVKYYHRPLSVILLLSSLLTSTVAISQNKSKDQKVINDSKLAKTEFINTDPLMKNLFANAYGYVIFPNIGKGGLGVGAATGNGVVYEKGGIAGMANMKQVTVGFQAGGQAYREVIFLETQEVLNRFKENKIEFSGQASAVAATKGASANVKYKNGVMIFTKAKGGLMYEASVGGQKFKFRNL
jgi:lipid-binding SYLF domain-containing protein